MKYFLMSFLAICLLSCQTDKADKIEINKTVITGEFADASNLDGRYMSGMLRQEIQIEEGRFQMTNLYTHPTFFEMRIDRNRITCYARPGDSLHISADQYDFDETLTFEGNMAEENKLLQEHVAYNLELLGDRTELFSLGQEGFLNQSNAIHDALIARIEGYPSEVPNLDEDFLNLLKHEAYYQHANRLRFYENRYKRYTGDTTTTDFTRIDDAYASMTRENPKALGSEAYKDYLIDHLWFLWDQYDVQMRGEGLKIAVAKGVDSMFQNQYIKEFVKFSGLVQAYRFVGPEGLPTLTEEFLASTENEYYTAKLTNVRDEWSNLVKGKAAPEFEYPDVDSVRHALSDYKGQYVYIDVWATWCKPCLAEQPHLAELEEHYKNNPNIVFMGVSVDKNYAAWEKMVREKQLQGVQLIKDDLSPGDISEDYKVSGIPRFILIDPDGNLVNAQAPRPSSDEIGGVLKELVEPAATL